MNSPTHEPKSQNHSIKDFSKEALHDLVHFDAKLIKTIKPLITRPGFLTAQAFTPSQNEYIKPLALFIFLNFIFFIFKSKGLFQYTLDVYNSIDFFKQIITERIAESHLSISLFAERFNTSMRFEQQEYVIIMVPLFALFMKLIYFRKKQYYTQHLVFALHLYSFAVIFFMVLPYAALVINYGISLTGNMFTLLNSELILDSILFIVLGFYLYAALKRVYTQSLVTTLFKTFFSAAFFFFLIVFVYRFILFFVVMHSVSE